MSGLIDIWMVERDRMPRTRGVQALWSVSFLGARDSQKRAPRSELDGSSGAAKQRDGNGRPDGAVALPVEEDAAAASVHEDALLSILVDCFGQ
ncbi:hypothetical protein PR202_ga13601 [Eleusine coracana subsp. coracana]|uniref:Uncharacterized protein n=1 Tax=Eleusine coracana subsp. coracana TaxID=191504 RepID=A0AAV5CEQ2_ELECO|nr:hypothetical protein PR202_ga13601 [Eleusine coracana subsp. coracana]